MKHPRFHATLAIPLVVFALVLSSLLPALTSAETAASSIHLAPAVLAPGDTLTVTGTGFAPRSLLGVYASLQVAGAARQLRALTRTDQAGSFATALTIPAGTTPASYAIHAKDLLGHAATENLVVLPLVLVQAGATPPPPPQNIGAHHRFLVRGTGFQAGERVLLSALFPLDNGSSITVTKTAAARSNGTFPDVLFQAPTNARSGLATLTVAGQTSKRQARAQVQIAVSVAVALRPATAVPGQAVTVSGGGFSPNVPVTVSASFRLRAGGNRTISAAARTNASGAFTAALVVPNGAAAGPITVTAAGPHLQAGARLTIGQRSLTVRLQPASARPGQSVTIIGSGFSPNVLITLSVAFPISPGGTRTRTTSVRTTANGTFTTSLVVPKEAIPGAVTARVSGPNGQASTRLTVAQPAVTASIQPSSAVPGQQVAVSGGGFSAGVPITVAATFRMRAGGTRTISTATRTNAAGVFVAALVVPNGAAPGTVTVRASGPHAQASARVIVGQRSLALSLQPGSARPGQTVTIVGSGFSPGVSVTVSTAFPIRTGGTRTISTVVRTAANGTFTTSVVVPSDAAAGAVTATASGPNGQASMQLTVGQRPVTASIQPSSAVPGQGVRVSGGGFSAGASITVAATFPMRTGGTRTISTATRTDTNGAFTVTFVVPNGAAPGAITVTVVGPHRKTTAALRIGQRALSLRVQPASGLPGQAIAVAGSGFSPGVSVTISGAFSLRTGGSQTTSTTARVSASGAFVGQLTVPSGAAPGQVTIWASGPNGQTRAVLAVAQRTGTVTIAPTAALPGQAVTVSGQGFSAGARIIVSTTLPLYGGGSRTVSTAATANARGQFSTQLAIPRNAASGAATILASGPNLRASGALQIRRIVALISVSPFSLIPGTAITVRGTGFLAGDTVAISAPITLSNGTHQTLTTSATTNAAGQFSATLNLPASATAGTYTVTARSTATGRAPTGRFVVATLAPSVVAVPTTAVPGTQVTVNGFGFASGTGITISLGSQRLATATAGAAGKFSTKVTIPNLASGSYPLSAVSTAGRKATINLTVNRQVSTHYYFAAFYTGRGYHEYLTFLNPAAIAARVTITYQPTVGATRTKTLTVNPHSRFTEDVNADLGPHVSAGAAIAADVPIVAERVVYHGVDGADVPGTTSPSTIWYFADGNSNKGYREYVAVENPNRGPVQVAVHLFPTHHRAFTVYRTVAPSARTTFKINSYVRDAVGVTVTANGPVVANRTIFIKHGMTSKIGVRAPQRTWYFAAGPRNTAARNWIGAINPSNRWTYVTLRAYGPLGRQLGTIRQWLRPFARVGYLMNKTAHSTDVAVVLQASRPIVAEQTTYVGRMHNAATDAMGVVAPARSWAFAAANTSNSQSDVLALFNPNLLPIPIVAQFMTASGTVTQRTYVVGPLSHQRVDVWSLYPNAQLGIVTASNYPFVALNRGFFDNHLGSMTSRGIHLP